jgi:hypothetical protein
VITALSCKKFNEANYSNILERINIKLEDLLSCEHTFVRQGVLFSKLCPFLTRVN